LRQGGITLVSIIYDALNKTQEIRSRLAVPKIKKKAIAYYRLGFYVGLELIFILLLIVTLLGYPRYKNYSAAKKPVTIAVKPRAVRPIHPKKPYILNGIFLSDTDSIAIINNVHYHLGDQVEGMNIIEIKEDLVKLKDKSHTIVLAMIH
jgi:hypothetical protein